MSVFIFNYDKLILLEFVNETYGFESILKNENGQTLNEDENWSLIFLLPKSLKLILKSIFC
jgi:hypothetical protein